MTDIPQWARVEAKRQLDIATGCQGVETLQPSPILVGVVDTLARALISEPIKEPPSSEIQGARVVLAAWEFWRGEPANEKLMGKGSFDDQIRDNILPALRAAGFAIVRRL